jgi:hypothetical protein
MASSHSAPAPPRGVLGAYERTPVENPWHKGVVSWVRGVAQWTNEAGVSWSFTLGGADGLVGATDDRCPYAGEPMEFERDDTGAICRFVFQGEQYERVGEVPPSDTIMVDDLLKRIGAEGELSPLGAQALEAWMTATAAYQVRVCGVLGFKRIPRAVHTHRR